MQFNTFVTSLADLERCVQAPGVQEVLLEPVLLARQGKLSEPAVYTLAEAAHERGLRPVLVWDILMPERVMQSVVDRLQQWNLSLFAAIRVCDPGAAYWLKTQFPQMPIQFIVETGNHNLEALQGWCEIFSGSLERLILSIELPEDKLVEYCQVLPVDCELLGVGPILLFYSPRSLLSKPLNHPETTEEEQELYLQATAAFVDNPDRPLPTLETLHGTFLFLDKDQFVLDRLDALKAAGLHTVRLDLRHLSQSGDAATGIDHLCQQFQSDPGAVRRTWPRETRAPFFKANRTTALFPRMKSKVEAYRDESCLAEVIAGEKGKYVVFYTLRTFERSQIRRLALSTGEVIALPSDLNWRNLQGESVTEIRAEQLLLTDWIKKAVPGSLLLSESKMV